MAAATAPSPPRPLADRGGWLGTGEAAPLLGMRTAEGVRLLMTRGTRVPSGGVITLKAKWIGTRLRTRRAWIRRYIADVNAAREAGVSGAVLPLAPQSGCGRQPAYAAETTDKMRERWRQEQERARAMLAGG